MNTSQSADVLPSTAKSSKTPNVPPNTTPRSSSSPSSKTVSTTRAQSTKQKKGHLKSSRSSSSPSSTQSGLVKKPKRKGKKAAQRGGADPEPKIAFIFDFGQTLNIEHTGGSNFTTDNLNFPALFKRSTTTDASRALQKMAKDGLVFINSRAERKHLINLFADTSTIVDYTKNTKTSTIITDDKADSIPFALGEDYIYGNYIHNDNENENDDNEMDEFHEVINTKTNAAWANAKKVFNEHIIVEKLIKGKGFTNKDYVIFFDDTVDNVAQVPNIELQNDDRTEIPDYPCIIGIAQCNVNIDTSGLDERKAEVARCASNTAQIVSNILSAATPEAKKTILAGILGDAFTENDENDNDDTFKKYSKGENALNIKVYVKQSADGSPDPNAPPNSPHPPPDPTSLPNVDAENRVPALDTLIDEFMRDYGGPGMGDTVPLPMSQKKYIEDALTNIDKNIPTITINTIGKYTEYTDILTALFEYQGQYYNSLGYTTT